MKRRCSWSEDGASAREEDAPLAKLRADVHRAIKTNDTDALGKAILTLSGARVKDGALTNVDAALWAEASLHTQRKANEGLLVNIATHDKKHRDMSSLFRKIYMPLECVAKITEFLDIESRLQLATLNSSWRRLCDAYYFWECLDPFPTRSFSNYNELKQYLTKNKQRFIGCRSLQMPRIPTSFKLFQDIFATMPLLSSISLHNVIGCVALRHCILQCPNPANIVQLSIGLATRLSPSEISYALKCFVNLQAFSLSFWQDYRAGSVSFAALGTSISSLHHLKYLSLSQSILYPENYDINTDELNDSVFQRLANGCPHLRDLHLGSFHSVTEATWKKFAENCPKLRSLSIEDCGVTLSLESIDAFKDMARGELRYLAIIPRSLGNSSRFLPTPVGSYIEDSAMATLLEFVHSGVSPLKLFLKSAVNKSITAPEEMYLDRVVATRALYDQLVCTGHIAALRMYDEKQLLPSSYFADSEDKEPDRWY